MSRVAWGLSLAFATTAYGGHGVRAVVERPASSLTPLVRISGESPFIYLNRCSGGCLVTGGQSDDARDLISDIPPSGQFLVHEFTDENGNTGSAADADWAALRLCMQEVYSPFAVTITDQEPQNTSFTEVLVAGMPTDVQQPADYLGVATISANCSPVDNELAFAFANSHPGSGQDRIYQICWTAAQESAHAFGLDHEYQFTDGESACRDPMTYRDDCLGEKFFRNMEADCGTFAEAPCRCSSTQDSAALLYGVFGAGTPITAPPVVAITSPSDGATTLPDVVHATASAQRGVAKLGLFINGSRYAYLFSMVPYGAEGQPASDYALNVPASVPKGNLSISISASDDLGTTTMSDPVGVANGPPCMQATDCLANQTCGSGGACVYPAPTQALGSACSYDQQCTTWECGSFSTGNACTTDCEVDSESSCPAAFTCIANGSGGLCAIETGGCCDAGGSPIGSGAIAALVLGLVLRRRLSWRR
ncbi:MAG TPA: Ig-like domain-containing protein [Kofleriaceae bacterium]|nr:Ig-like domain-containing protein [Kofleriaceae bacterium]